MIQGIFRGDIKSALELKQLPSYIPARNFALALIDQTLVAQLNPDKTATATLPTSGSFYDRLRLAAERIHNEQLRRAISHAVDVGGDDVEEIQKHLEDWYDSAMDRVSGVFKRRSQRLQFWIGLVAAILLNVNTLTIADSLSKDAALRRAVVSQVEAGAQTDAELSKKPDDVIARVDRLGLPIGWSKGAVTALLLPISTPMALASTERFRVAMGWFQIFLGYVFTALAITLGAPFWFDVLNRLMVVRATVKPREKSQEEGSEDRPQSGATELTIVEKEPKTAPAVPKPPLHDTDIYASWPTIHDKQFEDEIPARAGAGS
jgi:hypothetical protein